NIDLANRKVFVPEGKGGKSRTAFLTGYACDVLEEYMKNGRKAVFGNYWRPEAEKLFGASKSRLAAVLNEELFEVCSELEIPVITSHGFRHSLGTHLLQNGCDMRYIQVILGHESIGTTQVYTNVYKEDLRNSIDEFHPRNYRRKEI
ncbi:MAG: tyrosine-type recombinase/integrase, partial [Treponema sp.]|nr:tyrosine-type recombinase/integrase [Treponema sp.]